MPQVRARDVVLCGITASDPEEAAPEQTQPTSACRVFPPSRSTSVSNVAAWSVANPALALAYERKSGALLSLDCWCVP